MRTKRKLSLTQKMMIAAGILFALSRISAFPIWVWISTHPMHQSAAGTRSSALFCPIHVTGNENAIARIGRRTKRRATQLRLPQVKLIGQDRTWLAEFLEQNEGNRFVRLDL